MAAEGQGGGYLPPEPSGSAPDLDQAETRDLGSTDPGPQSPGGYAPPAGAQPGAGAPPQAPPPTAPPGYWQAQPQQPQQAWVYAPQPAEPDNGSAVAGFVFSLVAGGLLLVSVGLSSIVSVVCAAVGIFYSLRGRRRVDQGETPKHRGLAQAGFIIGIVSLVLAVLATLAYGALLILYLTDEDFQQDFERELDNELDSQSSTVVFGGLVALRLARGTLSLLG